MEGMARKIIELAGQNGILLEKNLASYEKLLEKSQSIYWRKEFWDLVEGYNQTSTRKVETIVGFDAHSTEDMRGREQITVYGFESALPRSGEINYVRGKGKVQHC